jgi:hypothetical protein
MRINYRKFVPRVGVLLVLVAGMIGLIVRCSAPASPVLGGVAYPIQERVHNYVHIAVQPVWYAESNTWLFSVRMQSTQNPSFLTIPLNTVAYIETDQYGSQVPNDWVWTQQESHETHGNLTWTPVVEAAALPADGSVNTGGRIALVVYVDEPIEFSWSSASANAT